MPIMKVLEVIEEFLKEKVTPTIKLQKADDDNVGEYLLVNPATHIGWIPPKGYWPEGMESAIPCLIVGFDEFSKDSEADYNIRISGAVYSPGLHKPNESDQTKIDYFPNFEGYRDLINLIDRTVDMLTKHHIIGQMVSIDGPVRSGIYQDQQPYPYWFGWITFSVKKNAVQAVELYKEHL